MLILKPLTNTLLAKWVFPIKNSRKMEFFQLLWLFSKSTAYTCTGTSFEKYNTFGSLRTYCTGTGECLCFV